MDRIGDFSGQEQNGRNGEDSGEKDDGDDQVECVRGDPTVDDEGSDKRNRPDECGEEKEENCRNSGKRTITLRIGGRLIFS